MKGVQKCKEQRTPGQSRKTSLEMGHLSLAVAEIKLAEKGRGPPGSITQQRYGLSMWGGVHDTLEVARPDAGMRRQEVPGAR